MIIPSPCFCGRKNVLMAHAKLCDNEVHSHMGCVSFGPPTNDPQRDLADSRALVERLTKERDELVMLSKIQPDGLIALLSNALDELEAARLSLRIADSTIREGVTAIDALGQSLAYCRGDYATAQRSSDEWRLNEAEAVRQLAHLRDVVARAKAVVEKYNTSNSPHRPVAKTGCSQCQLLAILSEADAARPMNDPSVESGPDEQVDCGIAHDLLARSYQWEPGRGCPSCGAAVSGAAEPAILSQASAPLKGNDE